MALINSQLVNVIENTTPAYLNWHDDNSTTIETEGEGVYFNPDMSYAFANASNMRLNMTAEWVGYYAFVQNMYRMAYECHHLSGNAACPENVSNMAEAFYNCTRLEKANIGASVTNYINAYYNCDNIKWIDIGAPNSSSVYNLAFGNNTSAARVQNISVKGNVKNMYCAFYNAPYLYANPACGENVNDFSYAYYNTFIKGNPVVGNKVYSSRYTYYNCKGLTGDARTGQSAVEVSGMFSNCTGLTGNLVIDNSAAFAGYAFSNCFNARGNLVVGKNVKQLIAAFVNCSNASNNIIAHYCNNVYTMDYTFYECRNVLGTPIISSNLSTMNYAYYNCHSISGNAWISPKTTSMAFAYQNCNHIEMINMNDAYLSLKYMNHAFDGCNLMRGYAVVPSSIVNAENAFAECTNLESFSVDNVAFPASMNNMFYNCYNAVGMAVIQSNENKIENAYYNCSNVNSIFVNVGNAVRVKNVVFGANTPIENVTDIFLGDITTDMFYAFDNSNVVNAQINHSISGRKGNNITNMSRAFAHCPGLIGDGWAANNVTDMNYAYYQCKNLDGTAYIPSSIENMSYANGAFVLCNNVRYYELGSPDLSNFATKVLVDSSSRTDIQGVRRFNIQDTVTNMYNFVGSNNDVARTIAGNVVGMNNVIDGRYAFYNAYYFHVYNTYNHICPPNLKYGDYMFHGCRYLKTPRCSNTVVTAGGMYANCYAMDGEIALSPNLTNIYCMYNGTNIYGQLPAYFKDLTLVNVEGAFHNCVRLTGPAIFSNGMPVNIFNMYYNCTNLDSLEIYNFASNFNSSIAYRAFAGGNVEMYKNGKNVCGNIKSINVYNTFKATNVTNMFPAIPNVESIAFYADDCHGGIAYNSWFNTDYNFTEMRMRWNTLCNDWGALKSIVVRGAKNASEFARGMQNCFKNLETLNVYMSTGNNVAHMFADCYTMNPSSVNINLGYAINNYSYFMQNCQNMTFNIDNINLGTPIVSNINAMKMFDNCYKITGNPWSSNYITNSQNMYYNCRNLTGAANVSTNSINTTSMYENCVNLTGNISVFNSTTNAVNMFKNCFNLKGEPQFSNVSNSCNCVNMYENCYALNNAMSEATELRFFKSATNCRQMFFNCYNLHGNALIKANMGYRLNAYYNCRNINAIKFQGAGTYEVYGSQFNLFFCSSAMNAQNIKSVYINGAGPGSAQPGVIVNSAYGLFNQLNWVNYISVDQPNCQGLLSLNSGAANTVNLLTTRVFSYAGANNFNALTKIAVHSNAVNAARMFCNPAYKSTNFTADLNLAYNLTNMWDMFWNCNRLIGNINIQSTKLENAACAFEGAKIGYAEIREPTAAKCNMAYMFKACKNFKGNYGGGNAYIPYNAYNIFEITCDCTNLENAWVRTCGSYNNALRGCTNIKNLFMGITYINNNFYNFRNIAFSSTSLANITTIYTNAQINNFYLAFDNCSTLKCKPNLPAYAYNTEYAYRNCPNLNVTGLSLSTTSPKVVGLFAGSTPAGVSGNIRFITTQTTNPDGYNLKEWLNAQRNSSHPRLNVFVKKNSIFDQWILGDLKGSGLPWADNGARWKNYSTITNGWYLRDKNIYIYNNA